jgi:hypothetical protein
MQRQVFRPAYPYTLDMLGRQTTTATLAYLLKTPAASSLYSSHVPLDKTYDLSSQAFP